MLHNDYTIAGQKKQQRLDNAEYIIYVVEHSEDMRLFS